MSSNPCSDSHFVNAIADALFTLEWLMNSRATAQFPPYSTDPTRSRERIHPCFVRERPNAGGPVHAMSLHLDADRPDQFAVLLMVAADARGEFLRCADVGLARAGRGEPLPDFGLR